MGFAGKNVFGSVSGDFHFAYGGMLSNGLRSQPNVAHRPLLSVSTRGLQRGCRPIEQAYRLPLVLSCSDPIDTSPELVRCVSGRPGGGRDEWGRSAWERPGVAAWAGWAILWG